MACIDRAATRAVAINYLTRTYPGSDKAGVNLRRYIAVNLPHLMARNCEHFDCSAGHTKWRHCPGCTAVPGGRVSREACSEHAGRESS